MPTLSETVCQSVQSQSAQLAAVSSVTASSVTVLWLANSIYYNRIASVFCTAACFCTYARCTHRNRTVYTADHHDLSTLALYSCIMHIPLRIWFCHLFPAHTHNRMLFAKLHLHFDEARHLCPARIFNQHAHRQGDIRICHSTCWYCIRHIA